MARGLARTLLLTLVVLNSLALTALLANEPLVFNSTPPTNDLRGNLAAQVLFAQNQVIPARPRQGDTQPHLTGLRRTLLMVRPRQSQPRDGLSVVAKNKAGTVLGTLELSPPSELPKTAFFVDGGPAEPIDFTTGSGSTGTVHECPDLERLADESAAFLRGELQRHAVVEIDTADGRWVGNVYLPSGTDLEGRVVRLASEASYQTTVFYGGRQVTLSRGERLQFKLVNGQWFRDGELANNALVYASDAWSTVLPAEWIVRGLSLQFRRGSQFGELRDFEIGPPTQLIIHTIELGMLTPPRGSFDFAHDPEAHREYFQTVPVSGFIVAQYAPLELPEVMLPTGQLYQGADPGEGGWHSGTMRQSIGKELISHGIDNANYGINSSSGQGEDSHPYVTAQLAAHKSCGNYANGIQLHGGSGGNGIVTLDQSLGNEFSHEVGHNYGLGHYVDGFRGSVHRSADQVNSTWGWDADRNRFLPNFFPGTSGQETCLEGECQPTFAGHAFGMDAMAGGQPHSGFNRFTLYTPNTAAIIQKFLEEKAVFDADSPTGFSHWNPKAGRMEPYRHTVDVATRVKAPIAELTEASLTTLLAEHDVVTIAMADGNWTREVVLPPASPANKGRVLEIDHQAGYDSFFLVNGTPFQVARGFQKSLVSNGRRWVEEKTGATAALRQPVEFGVPVVTLVGYYDPKGELTSYIYPALHGAYGFCYADDAATLGDGDCELRVETRDGVRRYRLASTRMNANVMNKFHINVPESLEPRRVEVVCRGRVLDEADIEPTSVKLSVTKNGFCGPFTTPANKR